MEKNVRFGFVIVEYSMRPFDELRYSKICSTLLNEEEASAWKRDHEGVDQALNCVPAVQIGEEIHYLVRSTPHGYRRGD